MKSKILAAVAAAFILLPAARVLAAENRGTPIAVTAEALQEFENRKKELDAREKELADRSKSLDMQEKILQEKLRKMEELNKKMADRLEVYKKEHEERITKMVSMVEAMKPQAAAEYVENLDPNLAVELLARLETKRAAKILNLADKKKTARLSELYTGYRDSIQDDTQKKSQEDQKQQSAKDGDLNRG